MGAHAADATDATAAAAALLALAGIWQDERPSRGELRLYTVTPFPREGCANVLTEYWRSEPRTGRVVRLRELDGRVQVLWCDKFVLRPLDGLRVEWLPLEPQRHRHWTWRRRHLPVPRTALAAKPFTLEDADFPSL